MELTGQFAVMSTGKALSQFIKKADLTLCTGSIKFNLSKLICLNKRSHILHDTLVKIVFCIYCKINDLSDEFGKIFIPDNLFNECFNGDIPSRWYIVNDRKLIGLGKARKLELITENLNTFDIIKIYDKSFDPKKITSNNLGQFISLNVNRLITKFENDDSMATYISPDEVNRLINQNFLVNEIRAILYNIPINMIRKNQIMINARRLRSNLPALKIDKFEKVNLVEFIKIAIELDKNLLLGELRKDDKINLLYAIIKSDVVMLSNCLKITDPRYNNNEYYFVALQIGNDEIINIIKETIILNTWLEKQVFINGFEQLIGVSELPFNITSHMKNTLYV